MEEKLFDIEVVSETMFLPLYCIALESRSKNPIIEDPKAVDITEKLNKRFRTSKKKLFRKLARGKLNKKLLVTISLRSRRFDEYIRAFLKTSPDGIIVNLGCGLSTHFERIDNGLLEWYDLDFPEVIDIRRLFFKESDRYHFISSSVLDFEWTDVLKNEKDRRFLFLAEGLFMYLHEADVKSLILKLHAEFPGSELVCEVANEYIVRLMRGRFAKGKFRRQFHVSEDIVYNFGIAKSDELEEWESGIEYLDEWTYFDEPEKKLGWFRLFRNIHIFRYAQWTIHYRLNTASQRISNRQ